VLVVPANSQFKTVKDLIEYGRANPGKLTFGHAGIGSQTHLAAENFVNTGKFNALSVPYKGEGPSLVGLVGGETSFAVSNMAAAIGHVNGGRLRALGVTSPAEAPQMPGIPPIGKTLTGFVNAGWFGIVAPTGTPKEIIEKVYHDTKTVLESSEMKARFFTIGMAPVGNSPAEFAKAMKEETAMWAKVVRERKISVK
jgi:tripartite-type tricarboxylate transporter receptor subunit TctC